MAKQNVVKEKVTQEEVLVDVQNVTRTAQHWFAENRQKLMYAGLLLVAVVGGYLAYSSYIKSNQKKALSSMWQAEMLFKQDSFSTALSNPGGYGFLEIANKYGSTPAGNVAHYYAGVCYLNLGKFDEAIQQLEKYSAKGSVTPAAKYGALGDAYSEKKDFAKALKMYKEASSAGGIDDLKAMYLKRYAMLSEIQGNKSEALNAYKEIKSKFPLTADAQGVEKYIARAEAK
jgi:tetratricopeptide (TPR) repeat protein